ncbi:hypothetical protein AB0N23_02530 [Streptomyces sp. NPDC052644]
MAITVGSVEVDVIPNTRGIYGRLRAGLVPAANRAGEDIARQLAQRITVTVSTAVRDGVQRGGRQAATVAGRQGSDAGGAFGRLFRTRVESALRSLPDITIGADTTEADADIRALRVQLETLSRQRVGVDVDAATARRQIEALERELQRLGASSPNVAVRINTAAAIGELATLRAEIDRLDGRDVDVRVDPSVRSFGMLATAAAAFGPAILPVLPVVAAGLGAVAAAGVAAGVGLGAVAAAAAPGLKDMVGALTAQKAAQDAAATAARNGAAAAAAGQQRAIQMASATQALAAAERNGARQVEAAQRQVTDARRNASQVAEQAAVRAQQAARQVEDAERALRDAQRTAVRAQEELTAARKSAADQLRDMNERLADGVLEERAAVLRVREAQEELNRARQSGAKGLDLDRAQLAYDQAVDALADQRREQARLREETTAANRAGVDGSEVVRSAQERLAQAQQEVADRARGVQDAQAEQARTSVQNARDIAEAQQRIVDASANVAVVQQQAADSIASAQRQVASASLSAASGMDAAAQAQAKYQAALAKMTPATRGTFDAFVRLRSAFSDWSRSLQPAVMPIFTRALDGIRRSLPGLTPFVLSAAEAIGRLQDRISAGFKSPWWQQFKADMAGAVGPAIEGLGIAFGNVFKGIMGIIQGFLPHMGSISERLQSITARFAEWATGLRGSPEFERFLSYAATQGPIIARMLGSVFGAIIQIGIALAPMAATAYSFITAVASGISAIPTPVLTALGVTIASIAIGARLAAIAMGLWRAATVAAGVVTRIMTGQTLALNAAMRANIIGLIVTAIMALVVALVYAYQNSETFRAIVQKAWDGIKAVVSWVWNNILQPIFKALGWWLGRLGDVLSQLWTEVFSPVFGWIGDKGTWLWENALKPAFDAIGKGVKAVGDSFEDAKEFIGKAWGKVQEIARKPVRFLIETLYNKAIVPTWNKVATAFGADPIKEMVLPKGFASGGVLPGYTPGRDVHRYVSPTGGALELSGGEAIMRPEFTRAVGSRFVHAMNAVARSRGASGVKAALAPALGGDPATPVDHTLRYADGGIFGWIGKKIGGAGTAVWNGVKKGASWLADTLERSARAGMKHVVDPLLARFPGADTNLGRMLRRIPTRILDSIFGYSKTADAKGAGGVGGPRIQAALKWARTQDGLAYQWGGNGNPSWDCSGFMSAIESVIRGQKPHRRWSTHAFNGGTPPGWVRNGNSPFRVGITHAGVGHTAGTLGGVNVESRGGDGVVVGKRARGYNDKLFTSWYGFQPGKYDSGGYLQPGLNLAYNGTGRPEPVFTTQQANALMSRAVAPGGFVEGQAVTLMVQDGPTLQAYVSDVADGRVAAVVEPAITAMRATRKG